MTKGKLKMGISKNTLVSSDSRNMSLKKEKERNWYKDEQKPKTNSRNKTPISSFSLSNPRKQKL